MALGEFTKQLAQQTIGQSAKDMLDSLRPPELSRISESLGLEKPAAPVAGDSLGAMIIGQLQAMQKPLKDDEELVVLCNTGVEMLRILEVFVPSWRVAVLIGIDTSKTVTRVVAPFESLQLVCKVMKAPAQAKPVRVRLITPKA
jgi:hypothetical protein